MWRRVAALVFALTSSWVGASHASAWRDVADSFFMAADPGADIPLQVVSTTLTQDGAGFLWGASDTGLLRWDGYRFRRYCAGPQDNSGLSDCLAQALFAGRDGTLWVGTATGGLARYDPASDRFVAAALGHDGPGARQVWAMAQDGGAGFWVAAGNGLFHLDQSGRELGWLHHERGQPRSAPEAHAQSLLIDRAGRMWVGGSFGLARAGPSGRDFVQVALGQTPVPEVAQLMEDGAGQIWAGTRQNGAFVISAGGAVTHIEPLGSVADGESGTEVTSMLEVGGRVWLATFGEGIVEVGGDGRILRRINRDPYVDGSLDSNSVYALYRDRSGLVWVSTTHGLSHLNPQNGGSLLALHGHPDARPGLSVGDVTGLLVQRDGRVWAASEHDGIDILGPDLRRLRTLPIRRVFAITQAASARGAGTSKADGENGGAKRDGDRVFVGTRGGLFMVDGGQRTARLVIPGRRDNAPVFALLERDGVLWAGGQDDGLYALRVSNAGDVGILRHLTAPELTGNWVHQIVPAPDGSLVIVAENGLNILPAPDAPVTRVQSGDGLLSGAHPYSLAFDRAGRAWVGHEGAGIDVLTLRGAVPRLIRHISLADGLPNLDICVMVPDGAGRIWLSTDDGIAAVNESSFAVRSFGRADGLNLAAFWNDSAAVLPDGGILFGGVEGLAYVYPKWVTDWTYTPPVAVTDVRIGGEHVAPGTLGRVGDGAALTVPAQARSFSLEFASLDFSAPSLNEYRFRLLGFESHWTDADAAHRIAAYTNISPGDYLLEVRNTNRSRSFSPLVARIAVHVLPAWFQTAWFRCLEAASSLVLVAAVAQARTFFLRARQRELERQVAERTAALSASEKTLHRMAYFDTLTALPNRRAFNEAFHQALEQPARTDFALALVDLDGFKSVNDTLGHDAGDELLLLAAARLRDALREGDFVARLGGDEFAILLMGVSVAGRASAICDRVVSTMAAPMFLRNGEARIGASVGVALFPLHGDDGEELYRHADRALYEAKRSGRGKWRWFGSELLG